MCRGDECVAKKDLEGKSGLNFQTGKKYQSPSQQLVVMQYYWFHLMRKSINIKLKNFLGSTNDVHFIRSHRNVRASNIAEAQWMRAVGIQTPQIFDSQTYYSGSYSKLGYIEKDLRNVLSNQERKELEFGDARCLLSYFQERCKENSNFYLKYVVDEDNHLCRIFWEDAQSRLDYESFGDVLAFDSTYRTNAYRKHFVMLAGVNNYFLTTIFGCAVIADETEDTYKWVLTTFFEEMGNKTPISVVTNGDNAMRNAIESIIPKARHRLCKWHLKRNIIVNLYKSAFLRDFKVVRNMIYTPIQFEERWLLLIKKHGLEHNSWVHDLYNKRRKWAESYLRGNFFAGMRSTQRSESLNASAQTYLKS